MLQGALGDHDIATLDKHYAVAARAVGDEDGMMPILRKENHLAGTMRCHACYQRVGSIQYCVAIWCDVLHDDLLDACDILGRVYMIHAEMVTLANIGHDGDGTFVETESFAQYATACCFEHGSLHMGMREHITCALGPAAITAVGLTAVDKHTIGIGHAHAQTICSEHVSDESGGSGFAVDTRDRDHRDSAVITLLEHQLHDGFTDVASFAVGRREVHTQSGCSIDFNDAAILFFQRTHDAFADDIDATNVQSHHGSGIDGASGNFGMYVIGHIGSGAAGAQVSVIAQDDAPTFFGDRIRMQILC